MDPHGLFKEYSSRQEFEHELINRRVTWLLTSQTILFAAYGLGIDNGAKLPSLFLVVIAACGLLSSFFLFLGIIAGALAKRRSWRDYLLLEKKYNIDQQELTEVERELYKLRREWGVRKGITRLGLIPDLLLPILFLGAWAIILIF